MTDPSKRYWITEQGIEEAAEEIRRQAYSNLDLLDAMVRDFCKVGPTPKSEVRRRIQEYADARIGLLLALIASHSEAASPPDAEQFLESLPARETFPINRTETAELLTKFATWLRWARVAKESIVQEVWPREAEAEAPVPAEQPSDFDGWERYWASLDKDSQEKLSSSGGLDAIRAWFGIGAVWGHSTVAAQKGPK